MIRKTVLALDSRVGAAPWFRSALRHVFPDHWSFMLGEVALYSFTVLLATGVFLTLFFDASMREVVYHGTYRPLDGLTMSSAYRSVIRLSFDVQGGLTIRQIHHWAALVFLAAIAVHAGRIFFTGAFRKPREINWFVGITMLLLAIVNGFAGYSLADDLLSGLGLRIAYSIIESIPVAGAWLAALLFGSDFPGEQIIGRLYIIHVLIVPAALATLIAVHLSLVWRQKHTQFPGPGRTERNVVGSHLFPTYAARSIALLLGVAAVLTLLGGLAQINPVWLWGPYSPAATTTAAQPDWYVGWVEGALRLFPPWEVRVGGFMIPNPFFPGVLMPGLLFVGMYAYPFIERRLTGDHTAHELLDRPRDHPARTGFGVAVITYLVVLFVAGSQDVIAAGLGISVQSLVHVLRAAVVLLPLVTGAIAWRWCRALSATPSPIEQPKAEDPTRRDDAADGGNEVVTGASAATNVSRTSAPGAPGAQGDNPVVKTAAKVAAAAALVAGLLPKHED